MKLTRLRVEQLRQFRQPLEISGFEPGLNVFTGPNEAGKSTLVAAIRAAFFERHRSKSVDDLQPWGDSSAAPTIELDFDLDGQPCRLAKRFLGRARCDLQLGARQFDGADAEDQLAELLGFQFAQKGSSKSEHWGIPGLLWITQGTAQSIAEPVSHAAGHLNRVLGQSLDHSLGEVASSRGDAILAKVEAARNELLTPSGGRPRGPFADAESQVAALETRLAELDSAIASYCRQVDKLAALRREHRAEEAEQPPSRTWSAISPAPASRPAILTSASACCASSLIPSPARKTTPAVATPTPSRPHAGPTTPAVSPPSGRPATPTPPAPPTPPARPCASPARKTPGNSWPPSSPRCASRPPTAPPASPRPKPPRPPCAPCRPRPPPAALTTPTSPPCASASASSTRTASASPLPPPGCNSPSTTAARSASATTR
ncbi:MAG: AAA family ATPase [Zoogloea sp.]|nr:AAA family ATPase [Zoogloea sp.]